MQGKAQRLARLATPLAACIQRINYTSYRMLTPSTECHRNSILSMEPTKSCLPWQHSSMDQKTSFRLITDSHSSTKSANMANIGPVDAEITGRTGIV